MNQEFVIIARSAVCFEIWSKQWSNSTVFTQRVAECSIRAEAERVVQALRKAAS